ncbi:MAG TPA: GNAT family N-acetyltransferase [Bacteroidales bacterium]|nr:GNAT family N-acetyltransferase [Bacteroidales bacterium]
MEKEMKPVVDPLPKSQVLAELTKDKRLRRTNNGNNEVYVFNNNNSPSLMHEVGRIRELTFRHAGGGTGKEIDIDDFDTDPESPQQQLIVWDPENQEIIGGYRFFFFPKPCRNCDITKLASSSYFNFSEKFLSKYLPHLMELGRSFVHPEYQSTNRGRKSLFALDNLWDGLGAIVLENPQIKYLFGKVTMYTHFNQRARDMIIYFLRRHFNDPDGLVIVKEPASIDIHEATMKEIFTGRSYKENYRILSSEVRKLNETIPPLINAYMNLSPTMRTFGTFINHKFGGVEETGIMITLRDIYVEKINRHLSSYKPDFIIKWFSRDHQ